MFAILKKEGRQQAFARGQAFCYVPNMTANMKFLIGLTIAVGIVSTCLIRSQNAIKGQQHVMENKLSAVNGRLAELQEECEILSEEVTQSIRREAATKAKIDIQQETLHTIGISIDGILNRQLAAERQIMTLRSR
jgi:hypothetical protein